MTKALSLLMLSLFGVIAAAKLIGWAATLQSHNADGTLMFPECPVHGPATCARVVDGEELCVECLKAGVATRLFAGRNAESRNTEADPNWKAQRDIFRDLHPCTNGGDAASGENASLGNR